MLDPARAARLVIMLLASLIGPLSAFADDAAQLLRQASDAAGEGDSAVAVRLATEALKHDAKLAAAYYLRGREHFRLSKIDESVADFHRFVELRPDLEARQWERGISYYFAGQFENGAKQFELYQTYYDNDVENSVWRYLCVARSDGVQKARETMLPIKNDPRVPMMEIYNMFRGKLQPDDVLQAARAGEPREEQLKIHLFYAHLYIGLFYEAEGNEELAKHHIVESEKHKIGHYMWDVAHVKARLLLDGNDTQK
jgi:lipoprotein NlpI